MSDEAARKAPAARRPQRMTAGSLERAALEYLGRYAASRAQFRQVLARKLARSIRAYGGDPDAGRQWIEVLITRLEAVGLLDDAAYAAGRARALFRRGASPMRIRAKLTTKGLSATDIEAALTGLDEMAASPSLAAALTYARRRRLGPFRRSQEREAHRQRDLASLCRQGFDYDLARRVIDTQELDVLEAEADFSASL